MPLPALAAVAAVVAAATAAIAAIYAAMPESLKDITREEFERYAKPHVDEYLQSVVAGAFDRLGLPLDPEQGITPQSVTDAINAGPLGGTGIALSNAFDKEACKRDVLRIALQQAAQAFGVTVDDTSAEGLKAALKAHISAQVEEQIAAGAGEWLELCPDLVDLSRSLAAAVRLGVIDAGGNLLEPEVAQDEFHAKLRERQARYRAQHTRTWVPGVPGAGGGA